MNLTRITKENAMIFKLGDKEVLRINEEIIDQMCLVTITGELLSSTTNDFFDEMAALVSVGESIRIDFEKVTYMSSSYMQSLLRIQLMMDKRNKGQELCLFKIPDKIYKDFEETGTSELLMIE